MNATETDLGGHEALVHWLASPQAYAAIPGDVERIETHISQVFLVGPLVYKLKKPVKFDFLDFSTLEAREHACREELRLNRRLAPQIYRRVVPVSLEADGSFCMDGKGAVIDWLVEMWRLPSDKMMDELYRRGALHPDGIDRLATLLARFYSNLPPVPLTADAYRSRCLSQMHGNLDDLLAGSHPMRRSVVQRVVGFQLQLLRLRPALFDQRVKAGRIVEGHGDLRPEHICFSEPIAIFDCIEFSERFRQLDIVDELAFLATECDYMGAAWVGQRLFRKFQELSGDHPPAVLVDFYKAYRASVRAKVAALRSQQLDGPAREAAISEVAIHLDLADHYAKPHLRPLVLVIGGLSGTGKSTIARALAKEFSADVLSSDVIRQDLFGRQAEGQVKEVDRYQPESREKVYQEMFRQAAALHRQGVAVVLDATFSNVADLRAAWALANHPQALFLAIECRCPSELARQRIEVRSRTGTDPSEASPAVHEQQISRWQPWPDSIPQVRVDTQQPIAELLQQVTAELAGLYQVSPRTSSSFPPEGGDSTG